MKKAVSRLLIGLFTMIVIEAGANDGVKIANGILNILGGVSAAASSSSSNNNSRQSLGNGASDPRQGFIRDGSYVAPADTPWKNTGSEQSATPPSGQQQSPNSGASAGAAAEEPVESIAPAKSPWQK